MYQENSRKAFLAAGPVAQDCLVKLTAAGVETCDAGDAPIGMTETGAALVGAHIGVRLMNTPGTMSVATGAVIVTGALLTTGAGGTVVPHTASTPVVGVALGDAVSGSVVEMMPLLIILSTDPAPSV